MNAYLVTIPETREYVEDAIMDDGSGPLGHWQPTGIYVAETPGQARRDALTDWTNRPRTGVYEDDFLSLRARLLVKDVELERGCADHVDPLWLRVHEVEDHGGGACDCPAEDVDAA